MIPLYYYDSKIGQGIVLDPDLEKIILSSGLRFHLHRDSQRTHPVAIPQWPEWPSRRKLKIHILAGMAKVFGVEPLSCALSEAKDGRPASLLGLLHRISRVSAPEVLDYRSISVYCYALDSLLEEPKYEV